MKAAFFQEHGGIEKIKVGDVDEPRIKSDELLVEAKYGGLNHLDLFILEGWPGLSLKMPHIMGSDGSGIVKEVGEHTSLFKPGDRVLINPGISCGKCYYCLSGQQNVCPEFIIKGEHIDGTYAELFSVPEANALKLPNNFSFALAAAAPLNFLTAWRMIKTRANLQPNEFIFIHGAGGGVSSAAIQIAKLIGGNVITTTSTEEKMKKAEEIGADYVFNYTEDNNYSKEIYVEVTNKKGVDVVIDSVGQATFNESVRLLKPNGRLIICGSTTGPQVSLDLRRIFWNQLQIKGSTMSNQQEFRDVMNFVFSGDLKPIVDKSYPLDKAAEAERYLQKGKQFGKVLLKI
ncbi:MAG: NAD-dependent alcohol dehydrogenase [Promethearchaeota archaeon]|nr:MAG: NAD-dependent alcohol dehydrogenase [Candidatus Lokiarchaeota archaeon]